MSGKVSKARPTSPEAKSTPRVGPPVPPKYRGGAGPAHPPARPVQNLHRAEQRNVRRAGARQQNVRGARPLPSVRPAAPPRKVMPRTPAPQPPPRPVARPRPAVVPAVAVVAATAGLLVLNTSAAHADISSTVSSLQNSLEELDERSNLSQVSADVEALDKEQNQAIELLESAREEGYRFQCQLEDSLYALVSEWQTKRAEVLEQLERRASQLQNQVTVINPLIQRLNSMLNRPTAAAPLLADAQTQVNHLLQKVYDAENELQGRYSQLETQVGQLIDRLNDVHWALDQLAEAKFQMQNGEDLVMAVKCRWDKESKDDPEGILYLTDRRLIFEQKEKVATKKILFITTASEMVHQVLLDQPVENLRSVKADNKGLFGHQDFILASFDDRKLDEVALHIDGQSSEDWAAMIESVRSGEIQSERVNGASSLSIKDLTRPLTTADIVALQNEVNALQDEMMLKTAQQELSNLENQMRSLERKLADLRAQGYEIEKGLEADISVLAVQWDRIKTNSETTLSYQSQQLSGQMQAIQQKLARLTSMAGNLAAARPLYMQVKSALASAEAQADAAYDTVMAQFDEYADEVESLDAHLDWISWMLDALATASFRLYATESGVAAVEAVFQYPNSKPENGILFLTDQRLLWEDRVGTFEMKLDVPLQKIEDVRKEVDDNESREQIIFRLAAGAPVYEARFELSLPVADSWLKMVGRARSGGYARDRAVEISAEELQRVRNAPKQCPSCGAVMTAPILRGQTEIQCEYCGLVTRI